MKKSLREENKEKLKQFRKFGKDWNGYDAEPFDSKYLDYIEDILNCIDDELQPEIFPIQGDFTLVQFEWRSVSDRFYLEMEVNLFNKYEIYYILDAKECKEKDKFAVTIRKENLNSMLKLLLNNNERRDI